MVVNDRICRVIDLPTSDLTSDAAEARGHLRCIELANGTKGETMRFELLHDLANAVLTLQGCIEAIKNGYRFGDQTAEQRIKSLEVAARAFARGTEELQIVLG